MEIAVIKKNYDPCGGGAERYAAQICSGLSKRGHRILIFSESFRNTGDTDACLITIPRTCLRGFSRTSNFHSAVRKTLKPYKYDISYSLSRTFPSDVFRVSEQIHTEWIKTAYPSWQKYNPRHREILKLEKKIYSPENTGGVVTNSMLTKKQIVANFAYPEEKIHFIGNGVDRAKFFPPTGKDEICKIRGRLDIPEDKLVLLFIAANFKIKGFRSILETLSLIPCETRRKLLVMAVGGNLDSKGTEKLEEHGLEKLVRFEGRKNNMRDYYVGSDMLFYPSLYEPFANVCLEACACGLPILTTATNGSSEVIEHNHGGFVVPSAADTELMARHIVRFMDMSSADRKSFSENAIRGSERYNWDEHIVQLEKLFGTLIKNKIKSELSP